MVAAVRQAHAAGEELAQMMLEFDAKSARLELLQQKLVDELDPAKIMAALEASGICLRPSGTEPKIKFYFSVIGESQVDSDQKLNALQEAIMEKVETMISSSVGEA